MHGLVKQPQYYVSFIVLWSQNDDFQPPQSSKFFLNRSLFTSAREFWVIAERVLSQVRQRREFCRVYGVTLQGKVRNCEIRETLNVESFLFRERSQLRWLGCVNRMPQERLAERVLLASPMGGQAAWEGTHGRASGPRCRPRIRLRDFISDLAWPRLGVEPADMSEIAENREVCRNLFGLLPHDPLEKAGVKMNE